MTLLQYLGVYVGDSCCPDGVQGTMRGNSFGGFGGFSGLGRPGGFGGGFGNFQQGIGWGPGSL